MAVSKIARVTIGLVGVSALTVGLAACSDAELTASEGSESAASTSPSPDALADRDGDGTLDEYDYAPTDPLVQRSEDVRPAAESSTPATAPTSDPAAPAPAAAAPAAPAAPAPAPAIVVVPDLTGMNYQAAQDLLRSKGLVVFPAVDGLGAGRFAVLDSNWYVVSQDVQPGSSVDAGTGVTCTILKYTDR